MNKCLLFFLLSLFAVGSSFSQSVCSYKYRKRITINPAYVSGPTDFTDFPIIISITGDNDLRVTTSGGHVQNSSGYDIMFVSSDGVTKLDHELTNYSSTNGDLDCWVKIPNLSTTANTYLYMYYGNSAISTDQSTTSTWSNGYVGVWHFDNSTNNSTSAAGLNGTNNGTTNNTTAKIGTARRFQSSSSQYIDVTPYRSAYDLNSNVTVSAWLRPSSVGVDQKIAGNQDDANGGWKFGLYTDNKLEFEIRTSSDSPYLSRSASGGTALLNNAWYHVVGEYSDAGDFINTYLNGALDRNYSTTAVCGTSPGTLKIGREPFSATAYLDARMDELRISNVVRSADWIATEYNNQNSPTPGTFYTISPEPKVWMGSSNTNWNTAANWSGASVPASYTDVIISNSTPANQPVLNVSTQLSSLWIYSGTTLSLSSQTLSIAYDITNCGTISGSTGMVTLNSTTANTQVQNLSGTGTYNLTDLTINNTFSNPSIVLNKDVNVSGALTLSSGIVYTSTTNILALANNATSSSGSANSFISGPISKSGTANFVFPVGKGTKWRRASVSNLSASATFRAEYFNTAYTSTTPVTSPLHHVSSLEYWQVDRIAGAGNANLGLYWEDASSSVINSCANLTIARWSGTAWDERPGTTAGGSSCSGSGAGSIVSNTAISAFSPFTFASKFANINVLPIELVDFTANCNETGVAFEWTTESEISNDYFSVERSIDGFHWTSVAKVAGAGNSKTRKNYSASDPTPLEGISYYRLRQVDWSQNSKTSENISINCQAHAENRISIYPNPASDNVTIDLDSAENEVESIIKITDATGRVFFEQQSDLTENKRYRSIPLNLSPGIYYVQIVSGHTVSYKSKLIVQASVN